MTRFSAKKLSLVAAVLMGTFSVLASAIVYDSGAIPTINAQADKERADLIKQAKRESTVEGTIEDRYGNPICRSEEAGTPGQVVSPAYSYLVGYNSPIYGLSGLRAKYEEQLFDGGDDNVGKTIRLTLDANLQESCYNLLQVEGSIIVMNASTGEILAAASRADASLEYDANAVDNEISGEGDAVKRQMDLYQEQDSFLLDRVLMSDDTAGSTMKVVITAAMIQAGMQGYLYDDTDGRFYTAAGACIQNIGGLCYGPDLNLQDALIHSSNTYFASAAVELGSANLTATMDAFCLNQTIELDFGTLSSSYTLDPMDKAELAQLGFGQGTMQLSPMNVALFMAPVVNGGTMQKPYLVQSIYDENSPLEEGKPQVLSQAMTEQQADTERELLHEVAVSDGFTEENYGCYVTLKTGTAQTHRGDNHLYYLMGVQTQEGENYVILVSVNNSSSTSSSIRNIASQALVYLMQS